MSDRNVDSICVTVDGLVRINELYFFSRPGGRDRSADGRNDCEVTILTIAILGVSQHFSTKRKSLGKAKVSSL